MSPYTVLLRPAAERDRRNLPSDVRRRISGLLLVLETDPRPMGTVKLSGQQNRWRIRVGDYRIIYEIDDARTKSSSSGSLTAARPTADVRAEPMIPTHL